MLNAWLFHRRQILLSVSSFNPLQYVFWFKKIWPHRYAGGKDKAFTTSCATSAQIHSCPLYCHLFWARSLICLIYWHSFARLIPPQSCASSLWSTSSPFFLTISRLRVSLNPDTASISSLWTTHLRHMCRNLTKKKRGSVKRRNMHTWPSSPLRL